MMILYDDDDDDVDDYDDNIGSRKVKSGIYFCAKKKIEVNENANV